MRASARACIWRAGGDMGAGALARVRGFLGGAGPPDCEKYKKQCGVFIISTACGVLE